MAIIVTCRIGHRFQAEDERAGKTVLCPEYQASFVVEEADELASAKSPRTPPQGVLLTVPAARASDGSAALFA